TLGRLHRGAGDLVADQETSVVPGGEEERRHEEHPRDDDEADGVLLAHESQSSTSARCRDPAGRFDLMRIGVLASGGGSNLEAILAAGIPVAVVVVDRPCRATELADEVG